jgi:hypothetical protein
VSNVSFEGINTHVYAQKEVSQNLNKFIVNMEQVLNENLPKDATQDEKQKHLDELHKKGVFGRSEYAKKEFWNERFKA